MADLDHIILKVKDVGESAAFYADVLGFRNDGIDGPFTVIRLNEASVLLLAPWGGSGSEHLAFAVSREEFDGIFGRIKSRGLDHGPGPTEVGANTGPGIELGARGEAPSLYFRDPNGHLLEIRTYAESNRAR
jgi:catechol 2,3-dioxygenase-like lactoylglutathione lyase family enzyme